MSSLFFLDGPSHQEGHGDKERSEEQKNCGHNNCKHFLVPSLSVCVYYISVLSVLQVFSCCHSSGGHRLGSVGFSEVLWGLSPTPPYLKSCLCFPMSPHSI
jgi:hypothetical protein